MKLIKFLNENGFNLRKKLYFPPRESNLKLPFINENVLT